MHDKSKLVYVSLLPERSCNLNNHLAEKAGAPVQWLEWWALEEREQIIDKTANVATK